MVLPLPLKVKIGLIMSFGLFTFLVITDTHVLLFPHFVEMIRILSPIFFFYRFNNSIVYFQYCYASLSLWETQQ